MLLIILCRGVCKLGSFTNLTSSSDFACDAERQARCCGLADNKWSSSRLNLLPNNTDEFPVRSCPASWSRLSMIDYSSLLHLCPKQ